MSSYMRKARTANGQEITTKMVEHARLTDPNAFRTGLICAYCVTPVEFVTGHTRQLGDGIATIESGFRRQKNCHHSEDCQFNLHGQITIIARSSEHDFIRAIKAGRYVLRLLAPNSPELDDAKATGAADSTRTQSTLDPSAKDKIYVQAGTRLSAYINSAVAALKVRAQCDDNAEIQKLLRLTYKGRRVPWTDFYFEYDDYFRCFDLVEERSREQERIPIAVRGAVREVKPVTSESGVTRTVLELVQVWRDSDDAGVTDAACFSIWSEDLQAFEHYSTGQEILAFGWWRAEDKKNGRFHNYNLVLWPKLGSQVCAFSDSPETTLQQTGTRPRFSAAERKPASSSPAAERTNHGIPQMAEKQQDETTSHQAEARLADERSDPAKILGEDDRNATNKGRAAQGAANSHGEPGENAQEQFSENLRVVRYRLKVLKQEAARVWRNFWSKD